MGLFRKLLRRGFYAAAAVSTLLLLTTLIVWPVSYYRRVYAWYGTASGDVYWLEPDSGRADVACFSGSAGPRGWHLGAVPPMLSHWSYQSWNTHDPDFPPALATPTFLGVCWFNLPPGAGWTEHRTLIPLSYLAVLFAILPLLAFRSIRRRRKLARVGLCRKCGYDLRVHAIGDKCPECGTEKKM